MRYNGIYLTTLEIVMENANSKTYMIVVVKATRKPVVLHGGLTMKEAVEKSEIFYEQSKTLFKGGFVPSGVSVQIVEQEYLNAVKNIEMGGLDFHKIPVDYQYGGY